jgi:hypothetical protein
LSSLPIRRINAQKPSPPALRHGHLSVTASDACQAQALVAYGELDPAFENEQILPATPQDGVSLADQGPRLVPGDVAGGRYVTGIVKSSKPHH